MTIEQMRNKLLEWYPFWNIDRFTDPQIVAIYEKERNLIVQEIIQMYSRSSCGELQQS